MDILRKFAKSIECPRSLMVNDSTRVIPVQFDSCCFIMIFNDFPMSLMYCTVWSNISGQYGKNENLKNSN